jgi:hypothetical protein
MTATWRAVHLCRNGIERIGNSGRWTPVNKKQTGSGAMLILIAIKTASRPADRRDDDAYSAEPRDPMNVVAGRR